jgi:hypothetical protein
VRHFKGMSQPVFREEPFNSAVRKLAQRLLTEDIAKQTSFSYLWRMALL